MKSALRMVQLAAVVVATTVDQPCRRAVPAFVDMLSISLMKPVDLLGEIQQAERL